MANTNSPNLDSILPLARSVTPGPLYFRSPQSQRVSSGRISQRRRSAPLSLRDINRAAIFEEALRQSHTVPPSSSLPQAAFSIEVAPSLISSASSTPSTVAFDVFPSSEAGTLPTTLPSLFSGSPLLGFESQMEFALPLQYNDIIYPSSYQSAYLSVLPEDEKINMTGNSDQQSSYGGGYAAGAAVASSSSVIGSPSTSVDEKAVHENYSAYSQPYSYATTSTVEQSSATAYSYPYAYTYGSSSDPRHHPAYEPSSYQHTPHHPHAYTSATSDYTPQHSQHRYSHSISIDPSVTHGERVTPSEPPKELRCYDHGCNGRIFSTHSNLLRHQREKSGNSSKSECPKCGAQFTRKTAMRGHMINDKCGKKSGYNTSQSRSPSQSDL